MEIDFNRYEPAIRRRIATAMAKAIDASLKTHECKNFTNDEVRRRFGICARLFHEMCYEAGYTLGRFEDSIVKCLQDALNGKHFMGARKARSWVNETKETLGGDPRFPDDKFELTSEGLYIPRGV